MDKRGWAGQDWLDAMREMSWVRWVQLNGIGETGWARAVQWDDPSRWGGDGGQLRGWRWAAGDQGSEGVEAAGVGGGCDGGIQLRRSKQGDSFSQWWHEVGGGGVAIQGIVCHDI